MFRTVFWDVLLCKMMMEAVRTSETSVDNYFTRQYIPEDNSEHHTRRRENLKSRKEKTANIVSKLSKQIRMKRRDKRGLSNKLRRIFRIM
jgi:hypothetical protein